MTQQVPEVTPEVIDAVVSAMTPEQFVEAAKQAVRSAPSSVLSELTRVVSEEQASRDRAERLDTLLNEEAIAATEDVPQRSEWREQGRRGYPKGFEVVRDGRYFRSTVPGNVWDPLSGEAWEEFDPEGDPLPWSQPGSSNPILPGQYRTFPKDGRTALWLNHHPANVWSPAELPHDVYPPGWEFIEYLDEDETPVTDEPAEDETPTEEAPAKGAPAWEPGVTYAPGDRVMHDGSEWVAKILHASHDGWAPSPATHAVWGRV